MQRPDDHTHWLSNEEYDKLLGQTRLKLNGIMAVFNTYGQQPYVHEAVEQALNVCENFGLRVRGIDKPLLIAPRGDVIK
jgi:hypothetical protein